MNLSHALIHQAQAQPNHTLIHFEGKHYSYAEIAHRAAQLAYTLSSKYGIAEVNIALLLPNLPEYIVSYYAAQMLGCATVAINSSFKQAEVRYLLEDSGATVLITTAELAANVPDDINALKIKLIAEGVAPHDYIALSDFTKGAPNKFTPIEKKADDVAALLYSSGTTGFPKGVMLTQVNIASNTQEAARLSGYRSDDTLAVFLPLFHVYGQNYLMHAAVQSGATLALFRRFVPHDVLTAIRELNITMFFGVPTIFIAVLAQDLSKYDLSTLRYEMSAAATLPEAISRQWTERFGRRIFEGYGLTECAPLACYNDEHAHRFGSVGRAVKGFELAIFDEACNKLPAGAQGEIVIRGPGVMKGYWAKPEASASTLVQAHGHTWLRSGDVGTMDEDGYVYIVDRVKDMINAAGFKVWPAEVEAYLYQIPQVQECAVYAVPDALKGEAVAAAIVVKPGTLLTSDAVMAYCKANIANYKVPVRVDIVAALPKSPTGKLLKRVLREQAQKA
jgi:long-chain acyl-CoA synthetase